MAIYRLEPFGPGNSIDCYLSHDDRHLPTWKFFARSERDIVSTIEALARDPTYKGTLKAGCYYPFVRLSQGGVKGIEEVEKGILTLDYPGPCSLGDTVDFELTDDFTLRIQKEAIPSILDWRKNEGAKGFGPLYAIKHFNGAGMAMRSFIPLDILLAISVANMRGLERDGICALNKSLLILAEAQNSKF